MSGGLLVVSSAAGASASVGVFDGNARSPTAGDFARSPTTTFPTCWIRVPPTGSASRKYVPGPGISRSTT